MRRYEYWYGANSVEYILQTAFGCLHHGGDVEGVFGIVVNLQRHVLPSVAGDFVTRGAEREVRQDRLLGLVMKVTPSFLLPLFLKYAGRHRNLIGAGAEDDLELGAAIYAVADPVRIRGVSQLRHAWRGGQSVFAAQRVVGNPAVAVITWDRHHA